MPCFTVRQTTLEVGKLDPGHLTAALNSLGLSAIQQGSRIFFSGGSYQEGKLTLRMADQAADQAAERKTAEIKQAYSAEVVKSQAKKFGWALKQVGKFEFQAVKRTL